MVTDIQNISKTCLGIGSRGHRGETLAFRQVLFDGEGLYIDLKLLNRRISYDIYFFSQMKHMKIIRP